MSGVLAERGVVAGCLIDRDCIADLADWLRPEMFADRPSQIVYQAITTCWENRTPPDLVTVSNAIENSGNGDIVSIADLANLVSDTFVTPAHAVYYGRQIRNAYRFRQVQAAYAVQAQRLLTNPDLDPAEAIQAMLGAIEVDPAQSGPRESPEFMDDMLQQVRGEYDGSIKPVIVPTGLSSIDRMIQGGFRLGQLIVLAARPSMGKTGLAAQIAASIARSTGAALIFSIEMNEQDVARRLASNYSGVPYEHMATSRLTAEELRRIEDAGEAMAARPLFIDATPGITVDQISLRIERLTATATVRVVVIDYLELIRSTSTKFESEERRLSAIVRDLKETARRLNVAIILLAQLNRKVEDRNPPIPRLSDLRYTGQIEADADLVFFMYREDYYLERGMLSITDAGQNTGICEVFLAKQRNGQTGTIRLTYNGPTFRFGVEHIG